MRRVWLSFFACCLLAVACAGERPTLDEGAAREVDPVDSEVAPITLRLAVPTDWSMDPADATPASVANRVVADLLYEGITRLDDEGAPTPGLAERWFVDETRTTWTFVFPLGLVDGDGAPISARDVKQSLERVAARGEADQSAINLLAVTGWRDRMTGAAGGVAGISAPDETTLVIRLDSPFEPLLEVLASPAFGITGTSESGLLRTTGAYRRTDDPAVLVAVAPGAAVATVELVADPAGPRAALAAGDADWAILAPADRSAGLDADVIRQPLDLQLAIVARHADPAARLALLGALEPLVLAADVRGVTARAVTDPVAGGELPELALVDVPGGSLESLGQSMAEQLESAGVVSESVVSDAATFAERVASGDALLFPVVLAGGADGSLGVLQAARPSGVDDVFGPDSATRSELAAAAEAQIDPTQRALFVEALERSLIDDGLLLPVGRFEVRVALGLRLDGLRHRPDGTLDLSSVVEASSS